MIRSDFTATLVVDGKEVLRLDRDRTGDDPANDLPDEIEETMRFAGFRPDENTEVRLAMPERPLHVVFGVGTHHIRPRTLRRLLDWLCPQNGPAPFWSEKAAYLLLKDGRCVIRQSPFAGLVVTRD